MDIQTFNNPDFGQIRTALSDEGEPLFCLADVCKALDIKNPSDCKSRLDPDGVQLLDNQGVVTTEGVIISELGNTAMNYIDESNLYTCIFQSRKPEAAAFQKWVTKEVLPSIRKTGGYILATQQDTEQEILARALLVANDTMKRQKKRLEAAERKAEEEEAKKNRLIDVCVQKSDIIHGLTDGIPLADLRQRLNQIVRQRCRNDGNYRDAWALLYSEFDKKYHIDVKRRIKNAGFKGGALDYIDAQMHRLPELFEIACRLFQSEYESLKASWENMAVEAYKASHFDTFEYI